MINVLREFVRESNRIEGILREPSVDELDVHEAFLARPLVTVEHLQEFVSVVAPRAVLRDELGLNVRVGDHFPPPGGPEIRSELEDLLLSVEDGPDPYGVHVAYELLHPFTDGNGRSGRVLWAWHMRECGLDPFALPFLHRFYYQTLSASRDRAGTR